MTAKHLSIDEKRAKIRSNYETIEVLRVKVNEATAGGRTGMTRAAYIKMIFDVTKKVDKQNQELARAKQDTRKLQRDISNSTSRLERNFSLVEQTILNDAKTDGWSGECYRLLKVMHENCDQLVKAIQDTGELIRHMRQLEDQIGAGGASAAVAGGGQVANRQQQMMTTES